MMISDPEINRYQFYQLKACSYFFLCFPNNYIASSPIYSHCHYFYICVINVDIYMCVRSPGLAFFPPCTEVLRSTEYVYLMFSQAPVWHAGVYWSIPSTGCSTLNATSIFPSQRRFMS